MTPTQLLKIKGEFFKKFVKDNGKDIEPSFRDPNGSVGPVWQFIESKLQAVEGEAVEDFANALAIEMTKPSVLAGGLEGMYRLFADFVMVFSRDYLKSNKLKNKDEVDIG